MRDVCDWSLQVDVCDKVDVNTRDPSLDSSYYSRFVYTLLDGSGEEVTFDSTPAKDPTGEVQVSLLMVVSRHGCPIYTHAYLSETPLYNLPRSFCLSLNES